MFANPSYKFDDICNARNATVCSLTEKLQQAERQIADFQNREGAICPEDYGFVEWIGVLQKRNEALTEKIKELEGKEA